MKKIFFVLLAMTMLFASCQDPAKGNIDSGVEGGGIEQTPTPEPTPVTETLKKRINDAKSGDVIDLGKEELIIKEDESYTVDKPLTIKHGNVKNATFSVASDGVIFDNLVGIHSVMIGEDVSDGEFKLKDCINVDIVYVNGGGSNSVHIWNTFIEKMFVNKKDVRIALKNNSTTKVNNLYVSTDCKLDTLSEEGDSAEENTSKLFGNVIINDAVENLTISGLSSVDKIMATGENPSSSLVINLDETVKISAADEIVKESIEENNAAFDASSIGAVDEDEKEVLVAAEESNNRVIVLTDWLESKYFQKYCYAWDETGHLFDGGYVASFDVTSFFNGNLPKEGENATVILKGKLDKPLKKLDVEFYDPTVEGWRWLSTHAVAEDVVANTEFKIKKDVYFFKGALENVYVRITYTADDLDDRATLIINDKQPAQKLFEIDLTEDLQNKDFTDNTEWGSPDYFIEADLSSKLAGAKKGDIVNVSFSAVSLANIKFMSANIRNKSYAPIVDELVRYFRNIKAGEKFSGNFDFVLKEDVPTGEGVVFFRLNCAIADADWKVAFLSKDFDGKVYRIDIDSILEPQRAVLEDSSYHYEFEAISLFDNQLPKKGDLLQFVINGSVDKDIRNAWIYLMDDELLSDTKWFFIENGEPFSLQASMQLSKDVTDSARIRLQYDTKYCDEAVMFMPIGLEHFEVDISDLCAGNKTYFQDNSTYSPDYVAFMYFGSKFDKTPKKNDVITVNFDAVVDANMGSLAGLLVAEYDWVSAEIKDCVTGIKAGKKFSFSYDLVLTADVPEGKELGIRIACPIADASRKPTFLASDFSGEVFEIDLDSVIEAKTFEKYNTVYFCDFDVTSLFSGNFPKPGDLILFELKGSLDKAVKNGYFFTVEDGQANSTTQWVGVPSDAQFILPGSVIMEKDVSSSLAVRFQYDAKDCDETATFTPAN